MYTEYQLGNYEKGCTNKTKKTSMQPATPPKRVKKSKQNVHHFLNKPSVMTITKSIDLITNNQVDAFIILVMAIIHPNEHVLFTTQVLFAPATGDGTHLKAHQERIIRIKES